MGILLGFEIFLFFGDMEHVELFLGIFYIPQF
jgi:hypothetical protein